MIKKYLVPLDGSALGEHALPWAQALAQKTKMPVELMRCFEPLASVYMMPPFAAAAPSTYDQTAIDEQLDQYLQDQVDKFPQGVAEKARYEGNPASVILERCESGDIEAVVMASHGRGGLGRWLLGSVATKVLRGSRTPVLVINASTDVPEQPELKRILVPLDGSETAEAALEFSVKLARAFGAELRLYQGITFTPIGHPDLDAAVALEVENAKDYLNSFKKRYADVKISVVAKIAGLSLGILKQSADCELVVMSSHGRSGVKRWLLGSVAENILQAIDKPLMIVYGRDQD
jgi:nucleotide-binding universal stress UspA family protein